MINLSGSYISSLAVQERIRRKSYLRNSINQNNLGVELQTSMMEQLQAMERVDYLERRIIKQNKEAAESNLELRR